MVKGMSMENSKNNPSENSEKSVEIWNSILRGAMNLPGARINRADYLRKELSKRVNKEELEKAIDTSPGEARIKASIIEKIAKSSINWHTAKTTGLSTLAGLPGGWIMAGTIPADLIQFYYHVIQIIQKLAYLYGWPQLTDEDDNIDDETLLRVTLFIGVMFGTDVANKAIKTLATRLATEIEKRLPQKALTKYGIYNVSKKVGLWIGIKVTKDSFSKSVGKLIPILGGIISGTITFFTFRPMSKRLKKHLKGLDLAK